MRKRIGSHVHQNVVAYIALFFALSGGAVAAGANLKEGDPAGGDLTGTYPNPTIAAGAVTGGTGGKVADDTLTGADILESSLGKVDDADTLDGQDSTAFGGGFVFGGADFSTFKSNFSAGVPLAGWSGGGSGPIIAPAGFEAKAFSFGVQQTLRPITAGDVEFTVLRNDSPTSVSCTASLGFSIDARCQDSDSITVSAGDTLRLEVTGTGSFNGVQVEVGWRAL